MPNCNKHSYFNQDPLSAHAEDIENDEMDDYAYVCINDQFLLPVSSDEKPPSDENHNIVTLVNIKFNSYFQKLKVMLHF